MSRLYAKTSFFAVAIARINLWTYNWFSHLSANTSQHPCQRLLVGMGGSLWISEIAQEHLFFSCQYKRNSSICFTSWKARNTSTRHVQWVWRAGWEMASESLYFFFKSPYTQCSSHIESLACILRNCAALVELKCMSPLDGHLHAVSRLTTFSL